MQDNKLIRYLKTLDGDEMKRFVLFLRSPYHSTNKPALKLAEHLSKYHPEYDSPRLKKETVFKKIYGADRPFHEGRLGQVMTQTVKLFEQFLTLETVHSDPLVTSKIRMQAFRNKRLDKAYAKEASQREKHIAKIPEGAKRYLEGYKLGRDLFYHPSTERLKVNIDSLEKYVGNLDHFYLWEKQITTNLLMNRELIFPKKYDIKLYDEITIAFSEKIQQNYTLSFFHRLIKTRKDFKKETIVSISEEFQVNFEKIEEEFRAIIYSLVKNMMAKVVRSNTEDISRQLFLLMKFAREEGIDLIDGKISTNNFTGLVSIASKEGAYDFALRVLENHINLVQEQDRDDVFNLGKGYVDFWRGTVENNIETIERAVDHLLKVNQNKPFFTYQVKSLLLRCYYELYLNDSQQRYFVNDFSFAFERHLQRDKSLSQSKLLAYSNFCKILRKIVRLKFEEKERTEKLPRLISQVHSEKILFGKEWLLRKLEEL